MIIDRRSQMVSRILLSESAINSALSRRKQGFESPRERHVICSALYFQNLSGLFV
jgi:hypothetical protein